MNELKPEDVMKALECCMLTNEQQECRCEECPLWETSVMVCQELLAYHALALLREKDARLEDLAQQCADIIMECDKRDAERLGELMEKDAEIKGLVDGWSKDQDRFEKLCAEKDAEIERLTINMNAYGLTAKNLANDFADYQADVKMDIAAARAEAITEFAERLKKFYSHLGGKTVGGSVEYHIEQVKKEMLGGEGYEQSRMESGM